MKSIKIALCSIVSVVCCVLLAACASPPQTKRLVNGAETLVLEGNGMVRANLYGPRHGAHPLLVVSFMCINTDTGKPFAAVQNYPTQKIKDGVVRSPLRDPAHNNMTFAYAYLTISGGSWTHPANDAKILIEVVQRDM